MREWFNFLENLKKEIDEPILQKWVYSLKIQKFDACNLYLEAKDKFQLLWFEEHLRQKVQKLKNGNDHPIRVHINLLENKSKREVLKFEPIESELPDHDFDNFYVSEHNRLSYQFLYELSHMDPKIPFASYNPILLFGPSNSGKTHLLISLAKELMKKGKKVLYVKAQTFTENVIDAMRQSSIFNFREKYRNVDLLILDDVHLLAKKSATQEEFFHTFNTLHTNGSQIILSSNSLPQHMKDIEPRLISRFQWGIILYLSEAQKETLRYILDQNMKKFNLSLNEEIIDFLLSNFLSIKNLQKAIHMLVLRTEEKKVFSSLSEINNLLQDLLIDLKREKCTHDTIIDTVATHFGITAQDILGKSQSKECSYPRQIAMFFCREILKHPYQKIAEIFSRDHSTVMTNIRNIQKIKETKTQNSYQNLLEIEKKIKR